MVVVVVVVVVEAGKFGVTESTTPKHPPLIYPAQLTTTNDTTSNLSCSPDATSPRSHH